MGWESGNFLRSRGGQQRHEESGVARACSSGHKRMNGEDLCGLIGDRLFVNASDPIILGIRLWFCLLFVL